MKSKTQKLRIYACIKKTSLYRSKVGVNVRKIVFSPLHTPVNDYDLIITVLFFQKERVFPKFINDVISKGGGGGTLNR